MCWNSFSDAWMLRAMASVWHTQVFWMCVRLESSRQGDQKLAECGRGRGEAWDGNPGGGGLSARLDDCGCST